jgi:hypothetical protein
MYQIVGRTVIFNWDFNQVLNDTILNDIATCDEIIFNNNVDSNICLITNNKFEYKYYNRWRGSRFNQNLDNLPHSIKNLTFGDSFNQPLDNLPSSIINLTFGSNFNQRLDNLPSGIINLTLGSSFNQCLDNLPSGIINLTLGSSFNQCLDNLPSGIINLTLGDGFNQCLDNLPSSINKITFRILWNDFTEFRKEIKKIPKNLTLVDISKAPNNSDLKKQFEKFNVEIIE